MKTYRIFGLALAVFCCMTLVIAASGARMVPEQGPDPGRSEENFPGPGFGHGNVTFNETDQELRAVQGNLTGSMERMHGPPPGNLSEMNSTIIGPRNGGGDGAGNTTGFSGNFTSPPPGSGNRTFFGNATELNVSGPPPWADHGGMQANATGQEYTTTGVVDQGLQQSNQDEVVEALLAWLRSLINSQE